MKHNLTITTSVLTLVLFAFTSCTKQTNPVVNTPPTPVGNFTKLDVHGSVHVILKSDTINKVGATVSGNVVYNYAGQTLSISGSGVTTLSIKALDALTVTGSANVISTDTLRMNQLVITSHGSSTIDLKLILKNMISINVTGSSDSYVLSGTCPKLNADINGSPAIHAYSFLTADCAVAMTGSGNYEIFSSNSLSANLKGSSILYYKGNPPVVTPISITGSAQLIKQ